METKSQFAPVVVAFADPTLTRDLEDALEHAGYRVLRCPDAEEALVTVDEARPRVLVVELGNGPADGPELLRALRGRSDVQVLAVTPDPDGVDGAHDVLREPFATRELVRRVDRLYSRAGT